MDEEMIERAMDKVLKKNLGEFFIEREKHYQHHKFLEDFIAWTEECKKTVTRTVARCLVMALIGLIVMGFVFWGSTHFKG